MPKENENSSDENFDEIQATDETNWQVETTKLREKAIRQRETTKNLRDALKERDVKLAEFEKSKPVSEKKSGDFGLLEKSYLRASGYNEPEEIALFKKWSEETGKSVDELVDHPFMKSEIESMRTSKANASATSHVQGESGSSGAKDTPEYYIAKGTYPEPTSQNLKLRAAIIDKMMGDSKQGKTFYND